jgi:hypothetical protein
MASSNLPSLPLTLTTPQSDMWMYAVISPFGAASDRKISANSLLATITAAISDISLQFDNGLGTATVSAAGKGKIRYNDTLKVFQFSADGAAYASFGATINPTNNVMPYRSSASAFLDSSYTITTSTLESSQAATARTSGSPTYYFRIITPADTTLAASVESVGVQIGGDTSGVTVTRQFATGALATQREYLFVPPTYGFVGASTVTNAVGVNISSPIAGTNATFTNSYALSLTPSAATHVGMLVNFSSANSSGDFLRCQTGGTTRISLSPFDLGGSRVGGSITLATTGPSDITFSGTVALGYCDLNGTFFLDALAGDFAYRNDLTHKLLLGVGAGATNSSMSIGQSAVGINTRGASAILHVVGVSTSFLNFEVDSAVGSTVDLALFLNTPTNTNTIGNMLTFTQNSSGSAATGFGQSHTYNLESSTTDGQNAALFSVSWTDATHASRTSAIQWQSVVNAGGLITRATLGTSKVLANNTTTTVQNITVASNTVASGICDYSIEVFDGTDIQVETGSFIYQVTNKGGALANNTITQPTGYPKNVTTSGTLTVTWTITAANPALLRINANSSLTPSAGYPRVTYTLRNLTSQAVAIQ